MSSSDNSGRLVWLTSYPKSGNTWVRAFLSAYQLSDPGEFKFSTMKQAVNPLSRNCFASALGVSASLLTLTEIIDLLPHFYGALNDDLTQSTLVKTHSTCLRTSSGGPVFHRGHSRAVILIVRNPLAIAASFSHHMRVDIDSAIVRMNQPDLTLAAGNRGIRPQLPQLLGSWSSHTQSWLEQDELPVFVLRYEQLRCDPTISFARLLDFLQIPVLPKKLAAAIAATDFDRLRAAEVQEGFREAVSGRAFFRLGKSEAWREELSPSQQMQIWQDHSSVMTRLGYLDPSDNESQEH